MTEKQPSGFQFELVGSEMIKEWECPICLMIIKDVVELPCSHIYCGTCLIYHEEKICPKEKRSKLKPKFICSLCSEEYLISQKRPIKSIDRMIQTSIKIKCKQFDKGCEWKGCIMDYEAHCKQCPFFVVECPNEDCHVNIQRKDLNDHFQVCDFRKVACPYCEMQLPFINFERHYDFCDLYPVNCTNDGCQETIPRNQVDIHCRNDCLHQVIDCDFHQAGCKTQIKRIDIGEHMTNATQQHMMMLLGMNLQLKTQFENSNQRIEALEESVRQKDEEIKNLKGFAIGIATIQSRLVKETLAEPQVELLDEDGFMNDEGELKWRKFVNQHLEEESNVSKFTAFIKRSIFDYNGSCPSFFNYTLNRMMPNKFYYGKKGEFCKINVARYIDNLQVIYTPLLTEYFTKDPTMGLRSGNDVVSYIKENCLYIVVGDWFQDTYLVSHNGWGNKIKMRGYLRRKKYSKFVIDNYIMIYCGYNSKVL